MSSPTDSVHPLSSADNHGPAITVATAYCLSIMLLALLTRLWIRSPLSSLFSHDDWTTTAATAVATVQSILILVAVQDGLGHRLDDNSAQSHHVRNMTYAGAILYVLALCLGKLAVVLLVLRIGASQQHRRAMGAFAAVVVAWGVASLFAIALPHDVENVSRGGQVARWIAIETIGLVFEVAILACIIYVVWNLRASGETKAAVITGFFFRIALFVIAPLRLYYLSASYADLSTPLTLAATVPEILTQLEMHYNIIGATIPCLRIFLRHFSSGYLGGLGLDAPDEYYVRSNTANATKGSIGGGVKSGSDPQSQRITVRTSVELQSLDIGKHESRSRGGSREEGEDDRASEGSANPLYPSRIMTSVSPR